jgi:predicted lipoprotein with Yx(FWY)xxD motif
VNVALDETGGAKIAETVLPRNEPDLLPPKDWQVVRFQPAATIALPDGIDARLAPSAQSVVLTDVNGLTLYAYDGQITRDGQGCFAKGCVFGWTPVAAPSLASDIGEFTVITRGDGTTQWAFKKQPLYTFNGDKYAGDVNGNGVDRRWQPAILSANFQPKGVEVHAVSGYGSVLSINGATLYGAYPFEKRWGGRDLADNFRNAYRKGKEFLDQGCLSTDCLKVWHPFLADDHAQPAGFWEVISRKDGRKQWAYKGYALYMNTDDQRPGDITGNDIYDYAIGEGHEKDVSRIVFLADFNTTTPGGAGVYWHVAKP